MKHITNSEAETNKLAAEFAKQVKPGSTIAMTGKLGAGKTTFTKGLARGMGIDKRILSPTFVIMREYELPSHKGFFYHLDLYRIKSVKDIKAIDLKELIKEGKNIVVIEWAEKIIKLLPEDAIKIKFTIKSRDVREITIETS